MVRDFGCEEVVFMRISLFYDVKTDIRAAKNTKPYRVLLCTAKYGQGSPPPSLQDLFL